MTNEELLLKEGAYYFGNRLLYKNQDVGVTAPGVGLVLLPEGEAHVARLKDITDVVAKPSREKKAKMDATPLAVVDVLE